MSEIKYEKNSKCSYCKKEINIDKDSFIMERDENGKDEYMHIDCYGKKVKKEIDRVINLGFENWKPQI